MVFFLPLLPARFYELFVAFLFDHLFLFMLENKPYIWSAQVVANRLGTICLTEETMFIEREVTPIKTAMTKRTTRSSGVILVETNVKTKEWEENR